LRKKKATNKRDEATFFKNYAKANINDGIFKKNGLACLFQRLALNPSGKREAGTLFFVAYELAR